MKENLDTILSTLNEERPKRSDGGFITRVILHLADGPEYSEFSIQHPIIYDPKWKAHCKKLAESEAKKIVQGS